MIVPAAHHPTLAFTIKMHTIPCTDASTCVTHRRECPVRRVVDQILVVGVYICDCDVGVRPELPIVRVVRPDDRNKPESMGNAADTVVYVAIGGLCTRSANRYEQTCPAKCSPASR